MSIINLDCYQEGYNNGLHDAMNGKSKRYTGFPKGKASVSSHCYDTYCNGYNDGYSDGLAKKNKVYQ